MSSGRVCILVDIIVSAHLRYQTDIRWRRNRLNIPKLERRNFDTWDCTLGWQKPLHSGMTATAAHWDDRNHCTLEWPKHCKLRWPKPLHSGMTKTTAHWDDRNHCTTGLLEPMHTWITGVTAHWDDSNHCTTGWPEPVTYLDDRNLFTLEWPGAAGRSRVQYIMVGGGVSYMYNHHSLLTWIEVGILWMMHCYLNSFTYGYKANKNFNLKLLLYFQEVLLSILSSIFVKCSIFLTILYNKDLN